MKTRVFQFRNGKFLFLRGNKWGNSQYTYGFNVTESPLNATRFERDGEPDIVPYLDGEFVTLDVKVTHD